VVLMRRSGEQREQGIARQNNEPLSELCVVEVFSRRLGAVPEQPERLVRVRAMFAQKMEEVLNE
ncbi:exonuclease subunit SbcD, partial [Erwinia amylovora]|nr:exonuclease subunit SbcD [Erwinia amylovora]